MNDPINDAQKRIEVANAEQRAIRKLDAPRGKFDAEYDRLVADALPATGDPLVPREVVRMVFDEMQRIHSMDWGWQMRLEPVRESAFWVSYAYRIALVARGEA